MNISQTLISQANAFFDSPASDFLTHSRILKTPHLFSIAVHNVFPALGPLLKEIRVYLAIAQTVLCSDLTGLQNEIKATKHQQI